MGNSYRIDCSNMTPSKLSRITPAPPEVVLEELSTCNFHLMSQLVSLSGIVVSAKKSDIACALIAALDGLVGSDDNGVALEVLSESSCRDKECVCQFLNLCVSEFSLM
ncbi:hypothetical protein PIB30_018109 [Stylosanthes scabra]|uniref:Uncharacterized protein n=1 Tax=Stylosanthes scabra TaxID=79078 RepID=A0ABU6Z8B1_9FABA|nr:hypothetical protein [Stylosanthes scabra]